MGPNIGIGSTRTGAVVGVDATLIKIYLGQEVLLLVRVNDHNISNVSVKNNDASDRQ